MEIGDVITTSSVTAQQGWPKMRFSMSFKAPPKTRFVLLVLGVDSETTPADPVKMLNDLGWFQKEENERKQETPSTVP